MPTFCTMPSQAYRAESVLVFGGPVSAAPPMRAEPMRTSAIDGRIGIRRSESIARVNSSHNPTVQMMSAVGCARSK
jgi:hypothetical protein